MVVCSVIITTEIAAMPSLAPRLSRLSPSAPKTALRAPQTVPFRSAEEAWFWTLGALAARREGARDRANGGRIDRPCEPDDVIRCLDLLFRSGKIGLAHARVLRAWGERRLTPRADFLAERGEWLLWRQACARLEWVLRVKGIVA